MHYCYSDSSVKEYTGNIDVWKMNGTKQYLKHYSNYLTLSFLAKSTPDRFERIALEKELQICQRKLVFWRRHPNFVQEDATKECARLKAQWSTSEIPAPSM